MGRNRRNIYLRKDGRWEGRRPVGNEDGRTVYLYIYAETRDEAEEKLLRLEREAGIMREGRSTFEAVAREWLSLKEPQLKASSVSQYRNVLEHYLLPAFGDRDIRTLKRGDFTAFSGKLLESGGNAGRGLSAATVGSVLTAAKDILLFAAREKELAVADIRGIPVKQARKLPKTLTAQEQARLEAALYADLTPCALGILLCLYTGMRIGEICALKWKDVSKADQSVSVSRTMQRIRKKDGNGTEIVLLSPKSDGSARLIPVPGHIALLLKKYRKPDEAWLLTGDTQKFMEPRTLQYRFKALLKSCSISYINFHALRHTFATRCNELGFDSKTLSEIMGHSAVSMTMGRYVHPSMAQRQKSMGLLRPLSAVR